MKHGKFRDHAWKSFVQLSGKTSEKLTSKIICEITKQLERKIQASFPCALKKIPAVYKCMVLPEKFSKTL